MPLAEFGGTLGIKRAAHLLRRATFGPTKQQIDSFAALNPTQAITQLFRQALPDPPTPLNAAGQPWAVAGQMDASVKDDELQENFKQWFIGQMLNPSLAYSAREKIVYFLHTHFTTIQTKVDDSRALYFQNKLFRLFALDATANAKTNFKELTKKVSIDNAMLLLLDGELNVKGNPNENYARELHELYTIGRGLDGTLPTTTEQGDYFLYKELDVQEAARVLSGWTNDKLFSTIDTDTNIPRGIVKGSPTNASSHDDDPKTFSEHFKNNIIQADPSLLSGGNATEASALDEIDQLIEQIYAQRETAKNICRKIYRFFVYHEITAAVDSDSPTFHYHDITDIVDTSIIDIMATDFIQGNFKLQPIIENLLRSQHFYENSGAVNDDNFGGIIKSPLDLAIGALRFFQFQLPDITTSTQAFYDQTGYIRDAIDKMGMHFFNPYDVSGYDAYHQYPIYNRSWITPNYLALRYKFIETLIKGDNPELININVYSWVKDNFPDVIAADAKSLIIALADYAFPVQDNLTFDTTADGTSGLTARRLNYFLTQLLQGFNEAYWTSRWGEGLPDLQAQLIYLFDAMLQSPEYQLF